MSASQILLELPVSLPAAAYDYGERTSGETHGVVLTKPHVVGLILDLAGYTADKDLGARALLEPSCGHGAFIVQALDRLLRSAKRYDRPARSLVDAVAAFDIDAEHVALSRANVSAALEAHGVKRADAAMLAERWITCGDFLLAPHQRRFDFVVGNPPYIRIEQLSPTLQAEYRRRYVSLYDRADLYVAFIERGLNLLSERGVLSFICADRWIANKYGAPLRNLVTSRFGVRAYVDLHRASPFDSDVIAYPSIFVLGPKGDDAVKVGHLETASDIECAALAKMMKAGEAATAPGATVALYDAWFSGSEPWVINSPEHLATLRALEARFEPIESHGTRVGIGVATGHDKLYIVSADADIESNRLVPLVMRDDIEQGQLRDSRRCVINAFADGGGVVDLARYPRLAKYFETHGADIRKRHVAQKNPASWFRTIDRVYPKLVGKPKLLIPDIAGSNEVAFDEGKYHPHHNLYFVTSESWDMEVLGGLLSSRVALYFVWSYAVKMRGGYLRFQAQYLRRIRLPAPSAIPAALAKSIKAAFRKRDFAKLDELALRAYDLDELPAFDFVDTRK